MNETVELVNIAKLLLQRFNPMRMNFLTWVNHFEYIANFLHVDSKIKVDFLLNLMLPICHTHLRQKIAPVNPAYLPYEMVLFHFEELYGCYQEQLAANFRLNNRNQMPGENVMSYHNCLAKLSMKANPCLKDEDFLIKFINGLRDEEIKEVLRHETSLTLSKAVTTAAMLECLKIWNIKK